MNAMHPPEPKVTLPASASQISLDFPGKDYGLGGSNLLSTEKLLCANGKYFCWPQYVQCGPYGFDPGQNYGEKT